MEKTIDASEVMFCHDSRSILDNKYPALLVNQLGVSGFGHIKPHNLVRVLESTYWFRKYGAKYKLPALVQKCIDESKNFSRTLQCVKQALHTLNGFLVKKFMALGPEIISYKELHEKGTRVFRDLLIDYTIKSREQMPNYVGVSIFEEAKNYFNYVKEYHCDNDLSKRLSILDYNFSCRSLGSFFGTELSRLRAFINVNRNAGLGDYTKSMAWSYRAVEICQTRNLGYLPQYIAREQAEAFHQVVTRPLEDLTEEQSSVIKKLVWDELKDAGIARNQLMRENPGFETLIKESVVLELKYTASVTTSVKNGGKVEDARHFLQIIRENGWRIPIRDLSTFEIIGQTPLLDIEAENNDSGINLSSILFWFALQVVVNFAVLRGLWDRTHFHFFKKKDGPQEDLKNLFVVDGILDAAVLLINEPGKGRKLVKSHPLLNWFLVPGSKLCQKILAQHPDHKAGLELGAHDWVHSKRISGDSLDASFMYVNGTGKVRDDIWFGYTDWTEATDRMAKRRGIAHLNAFFNYIGFPEFYGQLIAIMIREPQPVKEVVEKTSVDEYTEERYYVWKGYITEGFMMGNQMTKTLLHLCHASERMLAIKYLKDKDIEVLRDQNMLLYKTNHIEKIPYSFEKGVGVLSVLR